MAGFIEATGRQIPAGRLGHVLQYSLTNLSGCVFCSAAEKLLLFIQRTNCELKDIPKQRLSDDSIFFESWRTPSTACTVLQIDSDLLPLLPWVGGVKTLLGNQLAARANMVSRVSRPSSSSSGRICRSEVSGTSQPAMAHTSSMAIRSPSTGMFLEQGIQLNISAAAPTRPVMASWIL